MPLAVAARSDGGRVGARLVWSCTVGTSRGSVQAPGRFRRRRGHSTHVCCERPPSIDGPARSGSGASLSPVVKVEMVRGGLPISTATWPPLGPVVGQASRAARVGSDRFGVSPTSTRSGRRTLGSLIVGPFNQGSATAPGSWRCAGATRVPGQRQPGRGPLAPRLLRVTSMSQGPTAEGRRPSVRCSWASG